MSPRDPYVLDPALVEDPPQSWRGTLHMLGPGFVLTASIVGSGELIATTTLGAEAGFIALWAIILSCLMKVALQLEFGRHTILTGERALDALNRLPGPRAAGVHWTLWFWLAIQPLKILQVGGIVGAIAILLHGVVPLVPAGLIADAALATTVSIALWCGIVAVVTAALVSSEGYRFIERVCVVMVVAFTATTLVAVISLAWTSYAVTGTQLAEGLSGRLPTGKVLWTLIGAVGLTGVGGDEILQYTYWLIEKGYAAKTGRGDPSDPVWAARARGWIRTMYIDALASMVVYTIVTAGFYILGAAVLHARGDVPSGSALVDSLAHMYTESLGGWARGMFLLGAFVVLYSTVFSALAAWTRTFADAAGIFGLINFADDVVRRRVIVGLAWFFPLAWAAVFLVHREPVKMVAYGGVATAAMLLIVVVGATRFRWHQTPAELSPSRAYDFALVISIAALVGFAGYSTWAAIIRPPPPPVVPAPTPTVAAPIS